MSNYTHKTYGLAQRPPGLTDAQWAAVQAQFSKMLAASIRETPKK